MKGGQGIWIEGEKELYANMQKSLFSLTEAGRKGLRQAGMNIIADAKQNLKNGGHIATGGLRASGRVPSDRTCHQLPVQRPDRG